MVVMAIDRKLEIVIVGRLEVQDALQHRGSDCNAVFKRATMSDTAVQPWPTSDTVRHVQRGIKRETGGPKEGNRKEKLRARRRIPMGIRVGERENTK